LAGSSCESGPEPVDPSAIIAGMGNNYGPKRSDRRVTKQQAKSLLTESTCQPTDRTSGVRRPPRMKMLTASKVRSPAARTPL